MNYDNNPMNNNNLRTNQIRNESEDQRTRRQNRVGLVILGVTVLAFIGGFAATMDKRPAGITQTPSATTAVNTTATGTNEAAITPAAGNATTPTTSSTMPATGTSEAAGTNMAAAATTATSETVSGTTTTATTSTAPTETVTENPKVYTSEESCRGSVNGACQPISGGWTPINPAPEKTAVPEAVAPAAGTPATSTTPGDTSNED